MKFLLSFFAYCFAFGKIILNRVELMSNKGKKGGRYIGDSVESLGFASKDIAEMEGK